MLRRKSITQTLKSMSPDERRDALTELASELTHEEAVDMHDNLSIINHWSGIIFTYEDILALINDGTITPTIMQDVVNAVSSSGLWLEDMVEDLAEVGYDIILDIIEKVSERRVFLPEKYLASAGEGVGG